MARSFEAMMRDKKSSHERTNKQGFQTTFIIEALLLLICLMMVIAVFVAVVAYSVQANDYYAHKEAAITFGTNIAERFMASPEALEGDYEEGELMAVCDVNACHNAFGTLYDATISVEWNEHEMFLLETSKYVQDKEALR